jgi:hypothetical protein
LTTMAVLTLSARTIDQQDKASKPIPKNNVIRLNLCIIVLSF